MNFNDFTGYENLKIVTKDMSKIEDISKELGIFNLLPKKVSTYSKGEYARLAIARIILEDKPILLLDEPTGNLDNDNKTRVFNILKRISKNKLIICVTHDYVDDELITLNIENQTLKCISDLNNINHIDFDVTSKNKIFLPCIFFVKYMVLIFKKLPVKYFVFLLITLFIFLITTLRTSFINPKDKVKSILNDNSIELVTVDGNIESGYFLYNLSYSTIKFPCLYSLNDEFSINGINYKLDENSIYLNTSYKEYDKESFEELFGIDVLGYVEIEKYSLISNSVVKSDFETNGLTLQTNFSSSINDTLKKENLNYFKYSILPTANESLNENEIILYCRSDYFDRLNETLSSLLDQTIDVSTSSALYRACSNLKIKNIESYDTNNFEIKIEFSIEMLEKIENIYPLIYTLNYNDETYISNDSFDSIDIFSIKTNDNQINSNVYFLSQLNTILIVLNCCIIFLYIIFIILVIFLLSAIKKRFCNDFNLIKILGFGKINIVLLICINLIVSVYLCYFLSGSLIYFNFQAITNSLYKFYNIDSLEYSILIFNFAGITLLVFILVILCASIIYSKNNKNLNSVLKENKI